VTGYVILSDGVINESIFLLHLQQGTPSLSYRDV